MNINDMRKMFNNQHAPDETITCPYCEPGRTLDSYEEYKDPFGEITNMEFMKKEENTFCPWTGCFTCNSCYVRIGTPPLEDLLDNAYLMFRLKAEPLSYQDSVLIHKYLFL